MVLWLGRIMRYSRRKGRKIKGKEGSAIGRYIRSTSDILPKGKDMRSIADITEINKISPLTLRNFAYLADMRFSSVNPNAFGTSHIRCAVIRNQPQEYLRDTHEDS
jgi:hypothetical protein